MNRRAMLEMAGWAGVVGSSILGGCLSSAADTDYEWKYDVAGRLDAVSEGTVFARERSEREGVGRIIDFGPAPDGQVVALDAETGELRWTYGETGELSGYTELAVTDGVYFGYCGDDDCTGLYAVETDGDVRWSNDEGVSWYGPFVVDGVVYSGTDIGIVRAFDAATGEKRWTHQIRPQDSEVGSFGAIVDVTDAVYAETNAGVIALERETGSRRWRYDFGAEEIVFDVTVSDGVAYIVTSDRTAAVSDGDELWHWEFDEVDVGTRVTGIAAGHLFVLVETDRREYRLSAFDTTTGERDWVSDPLEPPNVEYNPRAAVHDEVVYLGTERLRALDAATGNERWDTAVDGEAVQSLTVVEESVAGDHAVFIHSDGTRLASFTPDGEQTWERSVDEPIRNYLVDDFVFVGTETGIYALNR